MAKKVANGVNKRQRRSSDQGAHLERGIDSSERNFTTGQRRSGGRRNFRGGEDVLRSWINNPAVRYVAGGIAAAILSRLAQNMSEKYPELSRFLRENIDNFEGKLGQYRTGFGGGEAESETRM